MRWNFTRSDWLPVGTAFTGPAFDPSKCENVIIHYIGTPRAPRNFKQWMLNVHNKTATKKPPYAYMYNSAIDLEGNLWEGRGTDFRNAANKATNPTTWSICVATDGEAAANPEQVQTIKRAVSDIRRFCNKQLGIIGHRQVDSTTCPGAGIFKQIQDGLFESSTPVKKGSKMVVLDYEPNTPRWTAFVWSGNLLSWITTGHADSVLRRLDTPRVVVTTDELDGIIESSRTANAVPPTLPTSLQTKWARQKF